MRHSQIVLQIPMDPSFDFHRLAVAQPRSHINVSPSQFRDGLGLVILNRMFGHLIPTLNLQCPHFLDPRFGVQGGYLFFIKAEGISSGDSVLGSPQKGS